MLRLDNLRPGGTLRWKAEDCRLEMSDSVMWKVNTSKVVAPPVLIKDRWVNPREQVLNVLITCQRYMLGKPSSLPSTEGSFTPSASMTVLGEKLGMDSWIGQASCCGLGREPFFSGAVALFIVVNYFTKGCYA
jgi:hypothetical protein